MSVLVSRNVVKLILTLVTLVILTLYFIWPTTQYQLGNIFFGNYPSLYNVRLAQYFFTTAAYPILGHEPVFAHYQLSRTYFIQGKLETSLQEALLELKAHPENKRTYYILGLTYGYLNREQEAIDAFSQFIEAYPESWAARNDKAWLQFRIADIDGALLTLDAVKGFQNPWIQNTYGTLLLNKGRKEEAKVAFKEAERLLANMTEAGWGSAYPGNDPRIYGTGLEGMRTSIKNNLQLIEESDSALSPTE